MLEVVVNDVNDASRLKGPEGNSLLLDDQLCLALHTAARAIARVYMETLRHAGLTYPQYLVLLCLLERDGLTVREIGERLELDSGTLTPLIKRLETNSVVKRKRASDDERMVQIWLTDKGRSLRDLALRARQHVVTKLDMSNQDISSLRKELRRLTHRLKSPSGDSVS